jgi:16S rRNA processing protein RimM
VTRPEPGLLDAATPVTVRDVSYRLARLAGTAAKPIVRLEGITDRASIEGLRGEPLWVAREHAPPLEEDEFWADDLVGLAVVDGAREVGVVERVLSMPSCELLVVGELLIPLIGDAVRGVDLEARRVDVDLGFLGAG